MPGFCWWFKGTRKLGKSHFIKKWSKKENIQKRREAANREQTKEQIKVNRILHHVGNARIHSFFSPEEWMKVYMGNAILVTLKPHSRASNTGFSNTYFSVLSHPGIPVLTQKKQFRLIALLLVLHTAPHLHRPQELGFPRTRTYFPREEWMDKSPKQSLSLEMTKQQKHIIHSTGGKEVCP